MVPSHPDTTLTVVGSPSMQEAVDDMVSALKLDLSTVIPEILSLKTEVQLPLTQGLYTRCRVLLNQCLDTGVPLREEDTQGVLAMGEALVRINAAQPSWHLLLTDILTALGMCKGRGHGPLSHVPDPLCYSLWRKSPGLWLLRL